MTSGKPAILSLPQNRESRKALKILGSRFRRNEKIIACEPLSEASPFSLDKRNWPRFKWFGFNPQAEKPPTEEERQDLIQPIIKGVLQEG